MLAITRKGHDWSDQVRPQAAAFHDCITTMGISLPAPKLARLEVRSNEDPGIESKMKEFSASAQFLVVVLPDKNPELYRHIKRLGDIRYGIPTVCVQALEGKFLKGSIQYFANVALKVNLKLGGTNQVAGQHPIVHEDKTMIVGIDVTHPSPGSAANAPSVAGMVANVNKQLGQWPAVLRIQTGRKEMVEALADMLKTRLRLWANQHAKSYPDNILVYRDGVSEGQYQTVIEEELPPLREACKETYPPSQTKRNLPRLTIVIVGKRHHTRFYPTKKTDAELSANPKPGTVVDRGITEARNWDFFLQAHSGLKGTVRPAHYHVVLDEIFRSQFPRAPANELESLTHQLCYAYGRATRAVKVCMPTYYADLLCDRARHYLSRVYDAASGDGQGDAQPQEVEVHDKLKDTMFYI